MTPKELELLMEKAQAGDAEAQYELGKKYYDGEDVEKDGSKAFYWAQLSAAQNSPKGQNLLGVCYRSGTGVEKDEKKAVEWYTKATEKWVSPDALYYLATCYAHGIAVPRNYYKALQYYIASYEVSKEGTLFSEIMPCIIANIYAKGLGVPKSRQQAIDWFAISNLTESDIYALAIDFYYGDDETKKDYAEAEFWFKYLLSTYEIYKIFKFDYYYYLGLIYKEGGYGVERNLPEAVKYFALAAEAGRVEGQMELAACYEYGMGVERDLQKALEWYIKAAEKNDEAKVTLEEFRLRHTVELEQQYSFANAGKRYDLFISWNHNDKQFKDDLVDQIEAYNFDDTGKNDEHVYPHYRAWESDRDAEGLIGECIRNAINNSKFFLVILSEHSIKSKWVRMEVETALKRVEEGSWSHKNLLVIYLNTENYDVGQAIAALPEGDVFKELSEFAAHFTMANNKQPAIKNICDRIRNGLEEDVLRNYAFRMTKGQANFKYSLRSQYADLAPAENLQGIADALLSFEEGYIQRDVYRATDNQPISLDALAHGGSFYLIGDGGTGKSLYISNLMRRYFDDDMFYLRINVIDYDGYLADCNHLTDLLSHELNRYLVDSDEYRSTHILVRARGDAGNPLTIVFDGLDEVNDEKKDKLLRLIEEYRKSNAGDRFIFTSRTRAYYDKLNLIFQGGLTLYVLRGFDESDQQKLYDNISKKLIKSDSPIQMRRDPTSPLDFAAPAMNADALKADFFVHLGAIGDEIKKNPLLLSNLIFIYLTNRGKDFPKHKFEIVGKSVGIFVNDLENDRGTLSRFKYGAYLTKEKLQNMLGNIAFCKLQGDTHDFRYLLIEYFKNGKCMNGDDPEMVGDSIFNYLYRRAIISTDKITHDIFTAFFACCYIYDNIYERREAYGIKSIQFCKGRSGDPDYDGKKYLQFRMKPYGEFGREDGMWPEVSSELIMKLDYEIHALTNAQMAANNPNYPVFDCTLKMALKERGFSDSAIAIISNFVEEQDGLYFSDFIRDYLQQ